MSDLDTAPTKEYLDLANADTPPLQPTPTELVDTQPAPQREPPVEPPAAKEAVQRQRKLQQQQEPSAPADGLELTADALQSARDNYACEYGLDYADEMVRKTGKVLEWSTKHLDMSARGPPAQAMQRAMKFWPDIKAGYSALLDTFKLDFRKAWTSSKSFDFVTTTCSTENSFRKRRDEVGSFKRQLQIQGLLGGDHPEAKEQAQNYVDMCLRPDLKAGVEGII